MPDDPYFDYFPDGESQSSQKNSKAIRSDLPGGQGESSEGGIPGDTSVNSTRKSRLMGIWEGISSAGLAETTLRLGTHALLVALIIIVAWAMREFYLRAQVADAPSAAVLAAELPTATPTEPAPELPPIQTRSHTFMASHAWYLCIQMCLHDRAPM